MFRSAFTILKNPLVERVITQTLSPCQQLASSNLALNSRYLHLTSVYRKEDKRAIIKAQPKKDEGTEGEKIIDIDNIVAQQGIFPDEHTPTRLFDGIPFKDIPIVNIKCSKNNTIMSVTSADGVIHALNTCGMEGYKNARKGTNIAAQATAISLCTKAIEQGFKSVRVRVRGLGPGRMSALKGLQMGGIDIISITDNTRVTWNPRRPRKARRV